jgi:hypothetical protein
MEALEDHVAQEVCLSHQTLLFLLPGSMDVVSLFHLPKVP